MFLNVNLSISFIDFDKYFENKTGYVILNLNFANSTYLLNSFWLDQVKARVAFLKLWIIIYNSLVMNLRCYSTFCLLISIYIKFF